jgi:hypothetical protein
MTDDDFPNRVAAGNDRILFDVRAMLVDEENGLPFCNTNAVPWSAKLARSVSVINGRKISI